MNNLYEQNLDIANELRSLLNKQVEEGRSTPGKSLKNDVPVKIEKYVEKLKSGKVSSRPKRFFKKYSK